jgi:DNA-binding transcriptional ArsR family regulator
MADLDAVLRALRAPARREILALIWDRELAAGEIAATFSLTPATISEHLAVLRKAGLVDMTRVGTSRRYRARPDALAGLHGAIESATKWTPAGLPERHLTATATKGAVVAAVEVTTDVETTFAAFTDDRLYSRWLEVPVTIQNGRFAATLEWGTEVRGTYELVAPPQLIVMSWDFDDDNVPVPGHPLTGYLRIRPGPGGGSHVEVHQLVDTSTQATFMEAAWGMVLGRLKTNIGAAVRSEATPRPRARRRKPPPGAQSAALAPPAPGRD